MDCRDGGKLDGLIDKWIEGGQIECYYEDNADQPGSWVVTHSLTMLASLTASAILRGEHIYQLSCIMYGA